jgi:GntR family transcriptional regulator
MVREAVKLLRDEGLVITEHGRGSYVRPVLPIRRIGSDRYHAEIEQLGRERAPATSFTRDHGIDWDAFRLDREFTEVPATPTLADLFEIEPGTMLLERRFVFNVAGQPQQMSLTHYLLDMVAGTPVADPANEPWPGGNIAQLYTLGLTVTGIRERVRARRAMTDEAETLRIAPGDPVVTITRLTYVGDRVVEVAHDIVIPADRVELDYWIDLAH